MSEATKASSGVDVLAWAAVGIVSAALVVGGYSYVANAPGAFGAKGVSIAQAEAKNAEVIDAGREIIAEREASKEAEAEAAAEAEREKSEDEERQEALDASKKRAESDTVRYIVWGDTLSQVSFESGVSVERLAEYNSISNVDLIYADSALRIPYVLIPAD